MKNNSHERDFKATVKAAQKVPKDRTLNIVGCQEDDEKSE